MGNENEKKKVDTKKKEKKDNENVNKMFENYDEPANMSLDDSINNSLNESFTYSAGGREKKQGLLSFNIDKTKKNAPKRNINIPKNKKKIDKMMEGSSSNIYGSLAASYGGIGAQLPPSAYSAEQTLNKLKNELGQKTKRSGKYIGELSDKPKKKIEKSSKQKLVSKLIKIHQKRPFTDVNNMKNYLQTTEGLNSVGEVDAKYYYTLAQINYTQFKRIGLMKELLKTPIKIPIVTSTPVDFLTNDSIYWDFFKYMYKRKKLEKEKDKPDFFFDCMMVDSVDIASTSVYVVKEGDSKLYKECYIEDFERYCATPNLIDINTILWDQLIVFESLKDFRYRDQQIFTWTVKTTEGREVIIFSNTKNMKDIEAYVKNIKRFYPDKKSLSSGVKLINKKAGYYYAQSGIKVTDFCPVTLLLPSMSDFMVKMNCSLDCEKFLESMIKEQKYWVPPYFLTFENIENCMTFFAVIYMVYGNNVREVKDFYGDVYNKYKSIPLVVNKFKQLYFAFKTACLAFIDGFTVNVKIDKLQNIINKCNIFLDNYRAVLQGENDYNIFAEFVGSADNCGNVLLKNFIEDKCANVSDCINIIKTVTTEALSPNFMTDDLEKRLRSAAYTVFQFMIDSITKPCINALRSRFAFLGNLMGDLTDNEAKEILVKLKNSIINDVRVQMELKQNENRIINESKRDLLRSMVSNIVQGNDPRDAISKAMADSNISQESVLQGVNLSNVDSQNLDKLPNSLSDAIRATSQNQAIIPRGQKQGQGQENQISNK